MPLLIGWECPLDNRSTPSPEPLSSTVFPNRLATQLSQRFSPTFPLLFRPSLKLPFGSEPSCLPITTPHLGLSLILLAFPFFVSPRSWGYLSSFWLPLALHPPHAWLLCLLPVSLPLGSPSVSGLHETISRCALHVGSITRSTKPREERRPQHHNNVTRNNSTREASTRNTRIFIESVTMVSPAPGIP